MKGFIAKISLTALFVLTIFSALGAGKVTFEANTQMLVAAGEPFRVEFTVNANPEENSFVAPSFDGFEQLAGPILSTGRSFESVNGSMTSSVKVTVSYVLVCHEAGNITIGSAEVVVDGRTYRTKPVPIEVVAESAPASQPQKDTRESGSVGDGQKRVGRDDILFRASVSRSTVYKGEPLRVIFKLYHRVGVVGIDDAKFPSLNGFWTQDLTDVNARSQRETLNGKIYETTVLKEYLLYPQLAGSLTIDPAKLTAVAQVVVPSRNPDPFFGGPEVYNVRCPVQTQKLSVTVKELPAGAPASFSGAVGNFTMDATLPPDHFAANSSATYTLRIAGTGNLTFVQAPKLMLPGSFEQYNVKASESINASSSGTTGYRQFEYPFIARAAGEYDIPAMEFSFFNPARAQYVTLSTKALSLEITPDVSGGSAGDPVVVGRGLSKEDVKLLGQDIRFIKLGGAQLHAQSTPFIFSTAYLILLGGILLL
ncbi:MAG: BatD family protein, partial [Alistipes sp.]